MHCFSRRHAQLTKGAPVPTARTTFSRRIRWYKCAVERSGPAQPRHPRESGQGHPGPKGVSSDTAGEPSLTPCGIIGKGWQPQPHSAGHIRTRRATLSGFTGPSSDKACKPTLTRGGSRRPRQASPASLSRYLRRNGTKAQSNSAGPPWTMWVCPARLSGECSGNGGIPSRVTPRGILQPAQKGNLMPKRG